MAQINLGGLKPLNIPDELYSSLKSRVKAGQITAGQGIVELYNKIEGEAQARSKEPGMASMGYSNVLAGYGLSISDWSKFASQARNSIENPNAITALSAALSGTEAPKIYAPGSLIEGSANSITKEWPSGGARPPDQSVNPINVNNLNTPAEIAYRERLAKMGGSAGVVTPPPITTDSIQAGLKALTDRITKEGYTDASGKVLLAPGSVYNPKTGIMGTINASSLGGNTTPYNLPTSNANSSGADMTHAGAEATNKSLADYIKLLTPTDSATSQTVKTLTASISKELEALKGRGAAQLSEEQAQGVEQKKQLLQSAQTELAQKTAEYKQIQSKYQALNADIEGKPVTMNSIIGSQAQVNRVMLAELNSKASEIALIQANVAGAQGNLKLAQDSADRAVNLKYSDAKDAVDVRLKQLELIQGELTKEEKVRSDAMTAYLKDIQSQIDYRRDLEKLEFAAQLKEKYETPNLQSVKGDDGKFYTFNPATGEYKASGFGPTSTRLPGPIQTRVQGIASQFDTEQVVKNFNQIAQAKAFVDSIPNNTQNPSDDQGLIYSFAKIMDPDSVVREGEYATVQKYSQSWVKAYGKSVSQAINGTGFLSAEARENIKKTISSKYSVAEKIYNNVYSEYGRRIDKVTGNTDGTDYITNYAGGVGTGNGFQGGSLNPQEDAAAQQTTPTPSAEPKKGFWGTIGDWLWGAEKVSAAEIEPSISPKANAQQIASAIKSVESGGNYNAKGGSGESGAYQFMPTTWKAWAGEFLGNSSAPMTQQNQDKVALAKINQWLQQGYNAEQIALLWNSGTTTPKKGVNKSGVAYDSGAYAQKVLKALG